MSSPAGYMVYGIYVYGIYVYGIWYMAKKNWSDLARFGTMVPLVPGGNFVLVRFGQIWSDLVLLTFASLLMRPLLT